MATGNVNEQIGAVQSEIEREKAKIEQVEAVLGVPSSWNQANPDLVLHLGRLLENLTELRKKENLLLQERACDPAPYCSLFVLSHFL